MHGAPFRKLFGQHAPLAAAFEQVGHRAEHLVQIYRPGTGYLACALQEGLDDLELFVRDVAGVGFLARPFFSLLAGDFEHVFSKSGTVGYEIGSATTEFKFLTLKLKPLTGYRRYISDVFGKIHSFRISDAMTAKSLEACSGQQKRKGNADE